VRDDARSSFRFVDIFARRVLSRRLVSLFLVLGKFSGIPFTLSRRRLSFCASFLVARARASSQEKERR